MKIRCQDCYYYYEGNDGEYGGGPFYVECSNQEINGMDRRRSLESLPAFPFYPAPGCFEPNPHMLPDHFFEKTIEEFNYEYYEWLNTAKEWSGDAVDLIERS